jgi:hypothetical protein
MIAAPMSSIRYRIYPKNKDIDKEKTYEKIVPRNDKSLPLLDESMFMN